MSPTDVAVDGNPSAKETAVTDKSIPDEKKPGEKPPGKFHYNPGNMSGKTAEKTTETIKDESEGLDEADKKTERPQK